jgi:hypothetical protein
VRTCTPNNAGLGGAIGVALSFAALFFLSRNYGPKVYELLTRTLPAIEKRLAAPTPKSQAITAPTEREEIEALAIEIKAVRAKLDVEAQGQFFQSLYLTAASVLSTLFWGFGELGASQYIEMAKTCVKASSSVPIT